MFCRLAPILGRDCRQQSPQKDGAPFHPPVTMAAGAFEECSAGAIIHGTLPCSKNVLVFSSKNLRSIIWWNIYLQSMCARFSHPEKLVPKTPRQANSHSQRLLFAHVPQIWEYFLGVGEKEILNQWIWINLKPMDLDGVWSTFFFDTLQVVVKHVEFAPCLTGMPWRPRHGVRMLFPEKWPQQEWHSQVAPAANRSRPYR